MKNKWLIVLLIVVILALVGGLVFCGLKISKLNAKINEYENAKTEVVEQKDETTSSTQVEEQKTESTGLSLEQILTFDESQIENLKERQHVSRSTVDDCKYVRVHAKNNTKKEFVAYIDTYAMKQILNKEVPYAAYDITTPKTVSKVVCCTCGQAEGNEVYMFLYTDGTADYFSSVDVINGNVQLKHLDMDNIMDIINVSVNYEESVGYLTFVAIKYDGTAYILIHKDGIVKLE